MAKPRGLAAWMQWVIYHAIAALSGLLWFPLGRFVNSQYFAGDPYAEGNLWIWLPLTGFLTGFAYRIAVRARGGKEPTAWWFATLFPMIAVLACVAVLLVGDDAAQYAPYLALYAIFGGFAAYIALGWLIIPLAIPYTMLLGWWYRKVERFATHASRRHVRHLVWGFLCLGAIGATEAPRVCRYMERSACEQAADLVGLQLPEGTTLFTRWNRDRLADSHRIWFRSSTRLPWPLVEFQQALSDPDDRDTLLARATEVGIETDDWTTFEQAKWYENGQTVQGMRVRTREADYLEVIPW